ncbi:hypothetical protein [Limosilactobacillus ingluviei]|nr:hypothetical protein [Limosilactobacillus ingluviei]
MSEEHLETAVEIKKELQKTSPTHRCSWTKHRQMMQEAGFDDSDTNENYRGLVKRYQAAIGELPTVEEQRNLVANSKLEAIRGEIGRLNSLKLENQEEARKLRKMIRETNKDMVLIEEIANAIRDTAFIEADNRVILPDMDNEEDNDMVVCLSDIHYGAHVDIPENYYSTEVVEDLMVNYLNKVINLIKKHNVAKVEIVNLGDLIEHAYMRNQNLYDSEETLSEQIVHVTKLIIMFIQGIRDHVELVSYRGIAGNHDRMQGDKNSNLNADHAVNISNYIIQMWIELSGSDVDYIPTDGYFTDLEDRGFNFAFVHGDRNNLKKLSTLAELGEQHNKHYDAVIGGHVHHFNMTEVSNNRFQVTFGSIKGMDDYSVRLGRKSSRSQGVVLISDTGFEIQKVTL